MLDTQRSSVNLYAPTAYRTFKQSQLTELVDMLRISEQNTELHAVTSADALQLNKHGTTIKGGYRMSNLMFTQCAQKLCPGASRLLPHIAGMPQFTDETTTSSAAFAISCWNNLVKLRVDTLSKYRVICNTHTKQYEGLVGHRQQYLNNYEILDRAINACTTSQEGNCEFYGARLIGRALTLWFRHKQPLFVVDRGVMSSSFYGGYYFTSQEASGTAVRGTLAVFCPYGVCLAPFRTFGARAARNQFGNQFTARLERLFRKVFDGTFETDIIRQGVAALLNTSLGFSPDMKEDQRNRQVNYVLKMLQSFNLQKDLAATVLSSVLYGEAAITDMAELPELSMLFSQRNMFDLFVQLLRKSRTCGPATRERLELLAYRTVVRRINF